MSPDTPDVTPNDAATPAAAPASEPGDAAAPAKRPRAPRKTAAKAETVAAAEASPAGESGSEDAAPAPAPRKRARKTTAGAGDAEAATPAAAAGEGGEPFSPREAASAAPGETGDRTSAPAPARREPAAEPRPPVEARAAGQPSVEAGSRAADEGERAGEARFSLGDDDASDDDETSVAGEGSAESAAAEGEGEGSRRSRSRRRRRGRRSGGEEGGERVEGGAEAAGAEGAERPPRAPRPEGPVVEFSTADAGETFAGVLSGAFDIDAEIVEGQPAIPAKRVLAAEPDAPKLHKVLAQSGIGSRRDMEQLIADGKVTVNGEVAHTGQRISFGDEVRVTGRVVKLRIAPPPARVIAYHKPSGEVVTMDDPEKRPTVFRRLPRLQHGKWQSVGRLDINTEGLLLFTNSGDLANKLMHPRFGVEREYAARVLGTLDPDARDKLLSGVTIDGQPAQFKSIEDGGGEGANRWYRVVITEGRNREVRKLFDAVGMAVSRLIRIRYGSVVLPKGLKRGVWVDLDDSDIRRLRQLAGAEEPQRSNPQPQQPQARADRGQNAGQRGVPPQQQPKARGRGRDRDRERDRDRDRDRDRNAASPAPFREPGDPSSIPNPLQQTFDRRAIQQRERPLAVADDIDEDGPIGPIPNPLQQTYDKRFVQGNRSPFGGKNKGGGKGGAGGGTPKQPDPLQTAVGYIGADAFVKKLHNRGGGGGRGRR